MDYVRKSIDSDILSNIIDLPEKLRHKKVEIIIFPYDETRSNANGSGQSLRGKLQAYNNPALIEKENSAWSEAVKENYENN